MNDIISNYILNISSNIIQSSLLIFLIIFGPLFVLMIALAIQEQVNVKKGKIVLSEKTPNT